jgi:hypothetical protein
MGAWASETIAARRSKNLPINNAGMHAGISQFGETLYKSCGKSVQQCSGCCCSFGSKLTGSIGAWVQ